MDESLVFPELTVVEEGFSAAIAHEAFLFTVNLHVSLQRPGPREPLPTLSTFEGFVSAVQPDVAGVVELKAEGGATGFAHIRFLEGVDHAVLAQAHLGLEGFGAERTAMRALVRVRRLVDPQVRRRGETFTAHRAGIRPRPRVDGQVITQTLPPGEAAAAQVAGERTNREMRQSVRTKR